MHRTALSLFSSDAVRYWRILFLFGFHVLRGIFLSQYVTRFITAFLILSVPSVASSSLVPLPSQNDTSTTSSVMPLANLLHTGKGIALFSFIHMHVQYMFVAVVKDSLPAWKAAALLWIQQFLPDKCCPAGGGFMSKMFGSIKAFFNKIPCISGVMLTIFMCLLWVPLDNLAGLAIYCKVVLSCYTLFLIVEDSLPSTVGKTDLSSSLTSPMSAAEGNAASSLVDPPLPHMMIKTSQQVSRRTSPSHSTVLTGTPLNGSANASTSSVGRSKGSSCSSPTSIVSRRQPRTANSNTDSSSSNRSFFSVWWLCEVLAGLGATVVTAFSGISPSSQLYLPPILIITLFGGMCFISGMYVTGVHNKNQQYPSSNEAPGVTPVTIVPDIEHCASSETRESPINSNFISTAPPTLLQSGRTNSHTAEEGGRRTFKEFALASLRTFKRPSMQAMTVVLGVVIFFEAWFQQYFLVLFLIVTPPGIDLSLVQYYIFPLCVFAVWVGPLILAPCIEMVFCNRCPYAMGSLGLCLLGLSGVVLVLLGMTAALSVESESKSAAPMTITTALPLSSSSASPSNVTTYIWFSERVFFLMVGWVWCFVGIIGGFRRTLEKLMVPTVINEDKVIFGRGIYGGKRQHSDEEDPQVLHIVEEIFKLLTLVGRCAATIFGCIFFWLVPMTAYGDVRSHVVSQSDSAFSFTINTQMENSISLYRRQLRVVTLSVGVSIFLLFSIALFVWRKFYRLYGHHKAFIESSSFTA